MTEEIDPAELARQQGARDSGIEVTTEVETVGAAAQHAREQGARDRGFSSAAEAAEADKAAKQ